MVAIVVAIVVFLAVFVLYGANIFISQKGYEVQQVRTRVVELAKTNEVLRLEVGQLKAPGRIQRIAETELGMTIPAQAVYSSAKASTVVARSVTPSDKIRD
ncbi:MAG: cell division protein FtsL [Negativicoccus succinicivorans]|nr:cell division protein FtsL [Negativicoccus succinicivorans]MBS5916995.1 cell division protein FtsL [Negativicoccus succinicivorans]MDU0986984.1 cell division protein FtsL [Negativicoccus succinicivorans]MDU2183673.1 cell division protein FtsL [Negativicoccus succinicivorans]MDU4202371.1 cell division protein FtsL [Negativicoccus succinicivorans]MDU4558250.1 cell division protein FtsL [Negativicoccus succinicivorans]